jgi:hypothetical protein
MKILKNEQHLWHLVTASMFGIVTVLMISFLISRGKVPSSIPLFDFFMLTLATFRVTRLLVHDVVLDFVRDLFANATGGLALSMHDLLDCPWCTGTWVALFLGFAYFATSLAWSFLLVMAVSGFGTLLTIFASLMTINLEEYDKNKH